MAASVSMVIFMVKLVEVYRLGLHWSYRPPRGRQRQAVQVRYHEQSKSLQEEPVWAQSVRHSLKSTLKGYFYTNLVGTLFVSSDFTEVNPEDDATNSG
jgi:hypothetical protein